jgi:hypothetical protein
VKPPRRRSWQSCNWLRCLVVGRVSVGRDHKPRIGAGYFAVALNGMQSSKIVFGAMSESL